jgi:uncharacterized membrane protein (UPF0127 family)
MNRECLGENEGMLFKFPYRNNLRFWMKSTYIPLDIAFLDDNGSILQIEEMYPLSTRAISSEKACRYALEVNQGWFRKNKIGVGDVVAGISSDKGNNIRSAQSLIGNPAIPDVLGIRPEEKPPVEQPEQPEQTNPQNQQPDQNNQQVNPKAQMFLDDRAKVRYAEQHNKSMQIVYQSKGSGQTLPPRKLLPVPGEGYPIRYGEGGEYFVAFDSSPTINGGEWQIMGNQIKRFLFSNIVALEVIEEFVQKPSNNKNKKKKGFSK